MYEAPNIFFNVGTIPSEILKHLSYILFSSYTSMLFVGNNTIRMHMVLI